MFKKSFLILNLFMCAVVYGYAKTPVEVITTCRDLAHFAEVIGGDKVKVTSLSRGEQDLHYVEPRPSMVMKLKKADLLVIIGMDLDLWIEGLIDASRNSNITIDAKGYVDASRGIYKLEVPQTKVDSSMGHIHIYGNPHYFAGPKNIPIVLENILQGLIKASPENEGYFKENRQKYLKLFNEALAKWEEALKPYKGTKIIAYHKLWEYFANDFGLDIAEHLEPKPGIPPSPAHLNFLINKIKQDNIKLIIQASFYPKKTGQMVSVQTGAKFLVLPPATGADSLSTYIDFMNYIVKQVAGLLTEK